MMKPKIVGWAYWLLSFLPLVVTRILFPFFPDTIPAHWDAAGQVNRYGSKFELFIFPVLILAIAHFSMWFHAWITKGFKDSKPVGPSTKIGLIVILNIAVYGILYKTYSEVHLHAATFDIYKAILVVFGLLNIVFAYYLPQSKRNCRIGIRIKRTLSDEAIWNKTHRLSGFCLTLGGLAAITASLLVNGFMCLYMLLIIEAVVLAILVLYSYYSYRNLGKAK